MYHSLVARQVRASFDLVNRHDYASLLASCSPDIRHQFGGDHALGGIRRDREALGRWLERLGRLTPDMRLTVRDVWVTGWPHRTTALVRWTNEAGNPDGTTYRNRGVHVIELRWGTVVSIDANEDSQAVVDLLAQLVAAGVAEAGEPAITS